MSSRRAWVLDRIPWLAARRPHGRDGECEVVTLASWSAFPIDVRRGRTVEVRCLSGVMLATFEGDVEDHVIEAGESFLVHGRGRLVLAALQPGRVAFRVRKDRREAQGERAFPAPSATGPRMGSAA
jgi:hypothetical protein